MLSLKFFQRILIKFGVEKKNLHQNFNFGSHLIHQNLPFMSGNTYGNWYRQGEATQEFAPPTLKK
jgi:hypothetical protein